MTAHGPLVGHDLIVQPARGLSGTINPVDKGCCCGGGDENRTRMASLEVINAPARTVKQTRAGSPWVTALGRLSPPAVAQQWPAEQPMFDF